MSLFNKKKILITHDSTFHTDDLFATATLSILNNGNVKIIRTRDPKIFQTGDYVYDVGGENISEKNLFDHHQKGGAGSRPNGIPYASFGLVWKTYGEQICGSKEVADKIDEKLVQPIDASDNGIDLCKFTGEVKPLFFQDIFYSFKPSWKEDQDIDKAFMQVLPLAIKILKREIIKTRDDLEAYSYVENIYNKTENKKLIVLDKNYPWGENLVTHSEPLLAVYPRVDGKWGVGTVPKILGSYERRLDLPESWAGKRDKELVEITGVADAVFCHNGRFMVVAGSRAGAIKLAEKALIS